MAALPRRPSSKAANSSSAEGLRLKAYLNPAQGRRAVRTGYGYTSAAGVSKVTAVMVMLASVPTDREGL